VYHAAKSATSSYGGGMTNGAMKLRMV